MRRRKRLTIFRITLALAVAAVMPVAAQAKGMPVDNGSQAEYQLGPGEIPYLSQGNGVDSSNLGGTLSPDDRNIYRGSVAPGESQVVVPYLSQGEGVNSPELGYVVGNSSDDRTFARDSRLETTTPVTSDGGSTIEVNPYAVTGFGLAMLLAMGIGFGIWHSRRTKLSPA
jgi:hypothetical protein